jgi:hypothetical protein
MRSHSAAEQISDITGRFAKVRACGNLIAIFVSNHLLLLFFSGEHCRGGVQH